MLYAENGPVEFKLKSALPALQVVLARGELFLCMS